MVSRSTTSLASRPRGFWTSLVDSLDALLFPLACRVCGADGLPTPFCAACREELREASAGACTRCGMSVGLWGNRDGGCSECRGRALGFEWARALGPYEGPIRTLCLDLKSDRNAWLARWVAELIVEAHGDDLKGLGASRVVAVPLHWRRRLTRGYDQAEALARPLARSLGIPFTRGLKRVESTPKLAPLSRTERVSVMREAFRVPQPREFSGQTVILVDDILTSGATCGSASRALKRAGAAKVVVVVVGRAEGRV